MQFFSIKDKRRGDSKLDTIGKESDKDEWGSTQS